MSPKITLLNGSSRNNGDTTSVINIIKQSISLSDLFLLDYQIGYFDYEFKNKEDDFHTVIDKYIVDCDILILASPVYWYSMSATLKTFLDRISDLLITRKEQGRKLRGKRLLTISVNNEIVEPEAYSIPYRMSANYLGMKYLGHFHVGVDNNNNNIIMNLDSIKHIQQKLID